MTVQPWNDETLVVQLADDPQLSEDMNEVLGRLQNACCCDVVVDLSGLNLLASSGLAKLLRLRKRMIEGGHRLVLCTPKNKVWGVFLATGLDSLFEFTPSVAEALARMQGGRA